MKFKFDDVVLVTNEKSFYYGLLGYVKEYDEKKQEYVIFDPSCEHTEGGVYKTREEGLEILSSRSVDLDEIRDIWNDGPDLKIVKNEEQKISKGNLLELIQLKEKF